MAFDNLKLDKGLYTTGKSFTQSLESIDPSENYIGTEYEGLDAYQRQLKRFNIKVSGGDSDCVAKFFNTTDSATLFPEYVSRAVRQGIQEKSIIDKIVATTTNIDSMDYRSIETVNDLDNLSLKDVAEGTHIPHAVIKTKDSLTTLHKRGRMLIASYEAIKFQKLDLFTITLKQIGSHIANDQVFDLINTVSNNEPEHIDIGGKLSFNTIVDIWNSINPYDLTTLLTDSSVIAKLLKLPEFRDASAGLNFHSTGKMITPLGSEIVKTNTIKGMNAMVCMDKNYAVERVQAGDVITEFDKLIDRQLERATITSITGFSCLNKDAIKIATNV